MTKYRAYYMINPPLGDQHYHPVKDIPAAIAWINDEANCQLQRDDISHNVFGLEVFEDNEWVEWDGEYDGEWRNGIHELTGG